MADKHFTCQACGAAFGSREELAKHNKHAHPDLAQKHQAGRSPKDREESDL